MQDRDWLSAIAAQARFPGERPPESGGHGDAGQWIDVIAHVIAQVIATPDSISSSPRYIDPAMPIPFESVLVPFVEAGRVMMSRDSECESRLLADAAWITLERALLALLSRTALQTLCSEFALHLGLTGSMPWAAASETRGYRAFVAHARSGGLRDILCVYPVLARLLATTVLNWCGSHADMIARLRNDWSQLRTVFGMQSGPCRVESIAPYRSDLHDGGRSVVILECGGQLLVYKPRPLAMEQAFGDVLEWVNARGFSSPFRRIPLLTHDAYGWMGYAAATPCANAMAVAQFYRRVGGLICLTTLMQATDIHYENLVASGDQPVLVDAETLFHPRLPDDNAASFGSTAVTNDVARALSDSGWCPPASGPDFSALGADGAVATPYPTAACLATNSDRMAFAYRPFHAPRRQNAPTLNGRREAAACHQAAILAGFDEMFRLVLRHRDALCDLVRGFGEPPGRFLARSSNTYGLLLQASLSPDTLRDGAARSRSFDRLRGDAGAGNSNPILARFADAEIHALERMDVPRFSTTDRDAARCWPSPMTQTVARIARVSARDLDDHLQQLRRQLARLTPSDPDQESCHG